jgi:hypothetical protein
LTEREVFVVGGTKPAPIIHGKTQGNNDFLTAHVGSQFREEGLQDY